MAEGAGLGARRKYCGNLAVAPCGAGRRVCAVWFWRVVELA